MATQTTGFPPISFSVSNVQQETFRLMELPLEILELVERSQRLGVEGGVRYVYMCRIVYSYFLSVFRHGSDSSADA
jgi:hypothetical protein